jgi:hypothetical protein
MKELQIQSFSENFQEKDKTIQNLQSQIKQFEVDKINLQNQNSTLQTELSFYVEQNDELPKMKKSLIENETQNSNQIKEIHKLKNLIVENKTFKFKI